MTFTTILVSGVLVNGNGRINTQPSFFSFLSPWWKRQPFCPCMSAYLGLQTVKWDKNTVNTADCCILDVSMNLLVQIFKYIGVIRFPGLFW